MSSNKATKDSVPSEETSNLHINQQELKPSPYTVFSTHKEKYALLVFISCSAFWSGMSTPIYYPAIQVLESYFDITEELVNVSVVVYLVAQGIAPTIFSTFADRYGRRPLLLICLTGFIGACVGLALARNYATILVLRIVQSSFIAPAIAISSGAVGDFTEKFERGGFIGVFSGLTLVGQGFGSLVGAGLIAGFNWRAIFWFLVIGAGTVLCLSIFLLPETGRNIVGNGSITPARLINRAPLLKIPQIIKRWHLDYPDIDSLVPGNEGVDFLTPFKIMSNLEIYICLFSQGIHFAIWTVMLTSLSTQLAKEYKYTVIQIGLCYLPSGVTGLFGSMFAGRVLDWNYKRSYRKFEKDLASGKIAEDAKFNIVKARVEVSVPFMLIAEGFAIMFGWCIAKKVHIAAVLVSSGIISCGCLSVVSINTTLLIDLYPNKSSASTSCINFTRCIHAAIFVAALTSMNKALTVGGTFTVLAGFAACSCVLLYLPLKYGMKWSEERERKQEETGRKQQEKKIVDVQNLNRYDV